MEGYVLSHAGHEDIAWNGAEWHGEVPHGTVPENKAQAVNIEMLAKGYMVRKDVMSKAKEFDQRHGLIATVAATVISVDRKFGLIEKIVVGTSTVNQQLKAVNEKYLVSGKTNSAFAVAEEKVNTTGSR
ncbi:hypothetical protein R1flu_023988 [Riccia fluitans]|uniref:Uncharacterized protein n=1 Tax=Riccia fluitans TaxID=41844 RepID=A0ABD1XWM0_9MARC